MNSSLYFLSQSVCVIAPSSLFNSCFLFSYLDLGHDFFLICCNLCHSFLSFVIIITSVGLSSFIFFTVCHKFHVFHYTCHFEFYTLHQFFFLSYTDVIHACHNYRSHHFYTLSPFRLSHKFHILLPSGMNNFLLSHLRDSSLVSSLPNFRACRVCHLFPANFQSLFTPHHLL